MRVPAVSNSHQRHEPGTTGSAPTKNTTNTAWIYVWNNYTEADAEYMRQFHRHCKQVRYHVFGKEVGKEGTPHLQGFVVFTSRKRFQTVKNLIGSDRGIN